MMKRLTVVSALLIFIMGFGSLARAQRIRTATRQVAAFSELETKVESAFAKNNISDLNQILSDDFEIWTPNESLSPIARDEWLQTAPELRPSTFRLHNMSVRTFGDVYVVSFSLDETVSGKTQTHFIVDVWKGMDQNAKLLVRYESPAPGPDTVKPAHRH